jgi:hypothetical protein
MIARTDARTATDALAPGVGAAPLAAAYTVPRHALIRGARAEAMLDRVFGTVAVEELRRGIFCASADLRSGQFGSRSGPPTESVGLSMRMPVLALAQVRGGGCSSTARSSTTCR